MTEQPEGAYLDHASTSPLRPEALAAMLPLLTEHFGNPSSANAPGRRAKLAVDDARDQVADALGCLPGEVVFCASGTEAANLAIMGAAAAAKRDRVQVHFVCSAIEHHSVLRAVETSGGRTVAVGADGIVDLDCLSETLRAQHVTGVAVMLANNEVGTIQPLGDVARVVRRWAPSAVLVVDAVHAAPWLDVAGICDAGAADVLFVSAHKFGGPKGIGALVVRGGTPWVPIGRGGAQERGRRPGTENVAGIAGMAAALTATVAQRPALVPRIARMRDRLADGIVASVPGIVESATDRTKKVAGSCHLLVSDVEQDELMFLLDSEGVYASAGSACASGASEPSHVLDAMGLGSKGTQRAALRLSLGYTTTEAEIDRALRVVPKVVEHLRSFK
jgi:cysteine desulfurase